MRVKIFSVDQDTAEENFERLTDTLDMFPDDETERYLVEEQISRDGRAWIGGGAAQLFLAVKA